MSAAPLVITLAVDEQTQASWDELRRRWFPPARLVVGAHLTLFHALPGEHEEAVLAECTAQVGATDPFTFEVDGARSLGRGVALVVRSPELLTLHARLRRRWAEWLTPQDRQPLRPHVTVQNKVTAEVAAETLAVLREETGPPAGLATGLAVWRYLGGPWEPVGLFGFGPGSFGGR
ncbi:2'-5' RNA ligase family protein [Amycolatopsis sp. OK19-0408]|uniref:2'-5' RNA ligase family protein n=1 Tax=Amycolatopsis iheyensis TaxID=2945988 RepID=A0A9X2SII2_9PSEU|nr:2'-5' RNA ligase family protein [Amycolatopsis iheyensis]MCR6482963.1 2'-5' RNA ligase family protein [Amycolatopsis iheyensis]